MPNITYPWAIDIDAAGRVNGVDFTVKGAGVLRCPGVYEAILNFNKIPPQFHPSALGTFIVSNCCGAGASMRNNGLNMSSMGVESYKVERILTIEDGQIKMEGKARYTPEALLLDIKIHGDVNLPDDLIGHSVYMKRVEPGIEDGQLIGIGEGSLFRSSGKDIPVKIETKYIVSPSPLPNPLTRTEFRIATEDGELRGLSYKLRIHSIFDGVNSMEKVATYQPMYFL